MSAPPQTGRDAEQFARARQAAADGNHEAAAQLLAGLITSGQRHADVLMLYSAVCEPLGKTRDALAAAQAAAKAAPARADILAHYGRLLLGQGQSTEALIWLERAVALDDRLAEAWYNLGYAASGAGEHGKAVAALDRAVELSPDWAMAWATRGFVQQQAGQWQESEDSLRRALAIDSALAFARHQYALTLRQLGRAEEALPWTQGAPQAETRLLRAHLLADLEPAEAVAGYRSVLAERPDLLDAHVSLSNLLPQLGRADEALASYAEALARAPTLDLYLSAIGAARSLRQYAAMQPWIAEAEARFGAIDDLRALEGLALSGLGDSQASLAVLEPLAAGGFAGVLGHCAYERLKLGDLDKAEEHALAATRAFADDQAPWAYLTIIWRLKQNPREQWLADYERLVMPVDLEPPAGFASEQEFMAALAEELHRLHTTTDHPAEQSLREGTQTRGMLFDRNSPLVRALAEQIRTQLEAPLSKLPADPAHPFLSRNSGRVEFATSWSVRLRSGGFHVHHIHHKGWLSSALYAELPPEVAQGGGGEGSLVFGVPPAELGIDLEPRRTVAPRVGRLVVFPSYFWHGTVPFESETPRLTVAFDALPA
jgi:tetratricopeptide (TPR) repeat protein